MKKIYMKPSICVEGLMQSDCLLVGSNTDPYDQHNSSPIQTYTGGDDAIDEDDVI